jgi:uncharacterized protein DUF4440
MIPSVVATRSATSLALSGGISCTCTRPVAISCLWSCQFLFQSARDTAPVRVMDLAMMYSTCSRRAPGSLDADDSDLKGTEQQWVEAYYRGDGKTLSRIEADDFTVIANGQKPQMKAEQIAAVEARGAVGVPAPNVEEEIRHYGDVALITGLSESSNVRFTTVWVKWMLNCAQSN